ncbi:MAG TPA: tetratricopeptide repeat protein [Verrucomicrobiae bacterium]|nr:tetratricopeptide repeat protein [Verrucomicrobiae bacterium]
MALAMTAQRSGLPAFVILEASDESARHNLLADHARSIAGPTTRIFLANTAFEAGGPWAGVNTLFAAIFPEIESERPDLVEKHIVELVYVLPRLRQRYTVKHRNLTDLAPIEERSRFFAADRAYRVLQGLIDLIQKWKSVKDADVPWVIVCDGYDKASMMSRFFFKELVRRLGERLHITLVLGVAPEMSRETQAFFPSHLSGVSLKVTAPFEPMEPMDPAEAEQHALSLEAGIAGDRIEMQLKLPELLRLWNVAGRKDKLVEYRHFGLETYNTLGLYEDAQYYGRGLLELALEVIPSDERKIWSIIVKMMMCHMGLGNAEAGIAFAEGPAIKNLSPSRNLWRAQFFYLVAMFYARYSKPRNLSRGEDYLELALQELDKAELPDHLRHFETVFNRNGLAMIRSFERKFDQAIDLCKTGLARLNQHLPADKHVLHRSILIYNIAQVYSSMGATEEAIAYYSEAIAMDPNYSEYYNERGSLYMHQGRTSDALRDYLQAIELSSPYYEVFTNLGQCYRKMGQMEPAVGAYTRSLELEPSHTLALLGRAQANEALEKREEAVRDYSAAIERDPAQWDSLACRGVLYYELGRLGESLRDLEAATLLNPDNADLQENRAIVLCDLGRHAEAAELLEEALQRTSSEAERKSLKDRLASISMGTKQGKVRSSNNRPVAAGMISGE